MAPASLEGRLRDYVDAAAGWCHSGPTRCAATPARRGGAGRPVASAARNLFGERTGLVRTGPAPLSVSQDELGLFKGVGSLIGDFTVFERSLALPQDEHRGGGGPGPGQPALVAFGAGTASSSGWAPLSGRAT